VIAVDLDQRKLELARQGADQTVRSDDEVAPLIRELTGGLRAQLVLDFVGADQALALAAQGRPGTG
jgi:alcohol dehydrogenase, propanol-preferring